MAIVNVKRSPILTFSATISLEVSAIKIFIEQLGIGAVAMTGVVPKVL